MKQTDPQHRSYMDCFRMGDLLHDQLNPAFIAQPDISLVYTAHLSRASFGSFARDHISATWPLGPVEGFQKSC